MTVTHKPGCKSGTTIKPVFFNCQFHHTTVLPMENKDFSQKLDLSLKSKARETSSKDDNFEIIFLKNYIPADKTYSWMYVILHSCIYMHYLSE